MAFELIPFPISILFVLVVGIAFLAVLWKLRQAGKTYSILFWLSAIAGIMLLVIFLYEIMATLF